MATIHPTSPDHVTDDSGNVSTLAQGQFDSLQNVMLQLLTGFTSHAAHLDRLPLSHEVSVAMLSAKMERLNEDQARTQGLIKNLGRLLVHLLQSPHDGDSLVGQCGLCGGSHPWEFCPTSSPGSHCCRCWEPDHTASRFRMFNIYV